MSDLCLIAETSGRGQIDIKNIINQNKFLPKSEWDAWDYFSYPKNTVFNIYNNNATVGSIYSFNSIRHRHRIINEAFLSLKNYDNEIQKKQAAKILSLIGVTINQMELREDIFLSVPEIKLFNDDGSLLLEWIFPEYRIGFCIDDDENKSSWYLVSKETNGGINTFGLLRLINKNILVWLFMYIIINNIL